MSIEDQVKIYLGDQVQAKHERSFIKNATLVMWF